MGWERKGPFWEYSQSVAAGTSEVIEIPSAGALSITAKPGDLGTVTVAYSSAPMQDIKDDVATWVDWPAGSANSAATDQRQGPTRAVKVTAATADARVELVCR